MCEFLGNGTWVSRFPSFYRFLSVFEVQKPVETKMQVYWCVTVTCDKNNEKINGWLTCLPVMRVRVLLGYESSNPYPNPSKTHQFTPGFSIPVPFPSKSKWRIHSDIIIKVISCIAIRALRISKVRCLSEDIERLEYKVDQAHPVALGLKLKAISQVLRWWCQDSQWVGSWDHQQIWELWLGRWTVLKPYLQGHQECNTMARVLQRLTLWVGAWDYHGSPWILSKKKSGCHHLLLPFGWERFVEWYWIRAQWWTHHGSMALVSW